MLGICHCFTLSLVVITLPTLVAFIDRPLPPHRFIFSNKNQFPLSWLHRLRGRRIRSCCCEWWHCSCWRDRTSYEAVGDDQCQRWYRSSFLQSRSLTLLPRLVWMSNSLDWAVFCVIFVEFDPTDCSLDCSRPCEKVCPADAIALEAAQTMAGGAYLVSKPGVLKVS